MLIKSESIEVIDRRQSLMLLFARETVWVRQMQDRVAMVAEGHSAIRSRKKRTVPQRRPGDVTGTIIREQHDKTGQVLRFASQTVRYPSSHPGCTKAWNAALHQ